MAKDQDELRAVQKELKKKLKEAKNSNRDTIQTRMEQNNTREVWSGMKQMMGFNRPAPRAEGDPESEI